MDDPVSKTPDTRTAMVLPASVDFDLDSEGSDHTTGLPHSMPSANDLAIYLGNQGITANTPITVYDTRGIYSAPRVWWMLKALGHQDVYILNGGQPAWEKAALPVSEQQQYGKLTYQATPRSGWFANSGAVLQAINTEAQLVDARSAPRFKGKCQSLVKEYVQVICLVRLIFLLTPYSKAGIFCQLIILRLFLTALISIYANLLFVRVVLGLPPA